MLFLIKTCLQFTRAVFKKCFVIFIHLLLFINIFSDNMEADILGANLYHRFLSGVAVPEPRRLPADAADLLPQTVTCVESILVSTGVHSSNVVSSRSRDDETVGDSVSPCQCHCHRDFADVTAELFSPSLFVNNVKNAVEHILQQQCDRS